MNFADLTKRLEALAIIDQTDQRRETAIEGTVQSLASKNLSETDLKKRGEDIYRSIGSVVQQLLDAPEQPERLGSVRVYAHHSNNMTRHTYREIYVGKRTLTLIKTDKLDTDGNIKKHVPLGNTDRHKGRELSIYWLEYGNWKDSRPVSGATSDEGSRLPGTNFGHLNHLLWIPWFAGSETLSDIANLTYGLQTLQGLGSYCGVELEI